MPVILAVGNSLVNNESDICQPDWNIHGRLAWDFFFSTKKSQMPSHPLTPNLERLLFSEFIFIGSVFP